MSFSSDVKEELSRQYGRSRHCQLAEIAGMLHDYTKYLAEDTDDHAERSAPYAKEILEETKAFTAEEIDIICLVIPPRKIQKILILRLDKQNKSEQQGYQHPG